MSTMSCQLPLSERLRNSGGVLCLLLLGAFVALLLSHAIVFVVSTINGPTQQLCMPVSSIYQQGIQGKPQRHHNCLTGVCVMCRVMCPCAASLLPEVSSAGLWHMFAVLCCVLRFALVGQQCHVPHRKA